MMLGLGAGMLGMVIGWYGGILWACGGMSPGGDLCGLVVFFTVPVGGLVGGIAGAVWGFLWRTPITS